MEKSGEITGERRDECCPLLSYLLYFPRVYRLLIAPTCLNKKKAASTRTLTLSFSPMWKIHHADWAAEELLAHSYPRYSFFHLFTPNLLPHLIIHIQSRPFNYPFDTTVSLLTQNLPFWLISLQSIKLFFPLSLIHSFIAFIHSIQWLFHLLIHWYFNPRIYLLFIYAPTHSVIHSIIHLAPHSQCALLLPIPPSGLLL